MPYSRIDIPTPRDLFIRQIEDQIISGKLAVGEKLPTERELEAETGIKQSVIHYALKELERMGFVRIAPRQGVYVADYTRNGNADTLNEILRFNGNRLTVKMATELVELRNALEGAALIKLAENRSDEDLAALRSVVDELRAMQGGEHSNTELAEVAKKFHYLICELCGNDIIPLVMNAFSPISSVLWKMCLRFWGVDGFIAHDEKIISLIEQGKGHEAQEFIIDIFNQYLEANKQYMK
ncbi:MAG: FadR/GntR family transcriptional regulator [Oscillospiraceae bacterium]|nr:FadR family transcriptional regulator [Oscillospiraceae bacterium]